MPQAFPHDILMKAGARTVHGSKERIRSVLRGEIPDRPPVYELVRNDAVLSHFAGETLTLENAHRVVPAAYQPMVDATRPGVRQPDEEKTIFLPDGRKQVFRRWTTWTEHVTYESSEVYAAHWRKALDCSWDWAEGDERSVSNHVNTHREVQTKIGEVFFFWSSCACPSLMAVYGEVGLEEFAYYLADCPEILLRRLEYNTVRGVQMIEHLPQDTDVEAVFLGDDIAFKTSTLVSPQWMRRHYFPLLKQVIDAYKRKNVKVLFHSDGNLMDILDDLVEAGVDGLNPLEVAAGMDIAEIHRRHPQLFLAGGIDVSQLLPYGTPGEIRDVVLRSIEEAGGRLMVGSSTEVHDEVPLKNYLAMWETAMSYRY